MPRPREKEEITVIDTEYGDFYCCDNCGATSEKASDIKHHKGCKPGESKYWEEFYSKEV